MDALTDGLVTLFNGLVTFARSVASPVVLAIIVCALCIAWLAVVDIEEMNRLGAKPHVGRH